MALKGNNKVVYLLEVSFTLFHKSFAWPSRDVRVGDGGYNMAQRKSISRQPQTSRRTCNFAGETLCFCCPQYQVFLRAAKELIDFRIYFLRICFNSVMIFINF